MKKLFFISIAVLFLATGTAVILHYWPHKDKWSFSSMRMDDCLARIRKEDRYALFQDNERRIRNWCTDHLDWFGESLWYKPKFEQMTEEETKTMHICIGTLVEDSMEKLPFRTIEDIFEYVLVSQQAKNHCYLAVGKARYQECVKRVNSKRIANGLPPIVPDPDGIDMCDEEGRW